MAIIDKDIMNKLDKEVKLIQLSNYHHSISVNTKEEIIGYVSNFSTEWVFKDQHGKETFLIRTNNVAEEID